MTNINIVGKFEKYLYPRIVPLVLDDSQKQRLKLTKYYDVKTSEEEKKEILKMIVSTTSYTPIAATTNIKEQIERDEINNLLIETQKTREQYWFDFLGKMLKHIQQMILDLRQFSQFLFRNLSLINKQFTELIFSHIFIEHNSDDLKTILQGERYGQTIIDYYLLSRTFAPRTTPRIILLYYLKTIHPIELYNSKSFIDTSNNYTAFLNIIRTTITEFSEMYPPAQTLVERHLTQFIGNIHQYFRTRIHLYITEFMNLYYLQRKKDPTLTKMDEDDELYALQIIENKRF